MLIACRSPSSSVLAHHPRRCTGCSSCGPRTPQERGAAEAPAAADGRRASITTALTQASASALSDVGALDALLGAHRAGVADPLQRDDRAVGPDGHGRHGRAGDRLRWRRSAYVRRRAADCGMPLVALRRRLHRGVRCPYLLRDAARRRGGCASSRSSFRRPSTCIARALRAGHALHHRAVDGRRRDAGAGRRGVPAAATTSRTSACRCPTRCKAFAERVPLLDARFFVTAVLTQREAGGNLSEVLDNLSA